MKSIRQLFRQPLKTMSGVLLIALSVAVLVTCVGQYASTWLTKENMSYNYDTIALISFDALMERHGSIVTHHTQLPEEKQAWVDQTISERTDLIKDESYTELYSAYIPGLRIDNFSQYLHTVNSDWFGELVDIGNPYRCALLEVTLDQVGTEIKEMAKWMQYEGQEEIKFRQSITILCTATVDRVIGLEEGFVSPVGKTIALLIRVYDETELEAMHLEAGAKYLVYGMDYSDVKGDYFTNLVRSNYPDQFLELFGDAYTAEEQVDCFMTVYDHSAMPVVAAIDTKFEIRPDLRKYMQWEGNDIKAQYIPVEEYPDYHVPTIQRISGSADEFLETEAASLWNRALEGLEISNHSFPVLAVDKLGNQAVFARDQARIVQGREFTQKEHDQGTKVCVISETVATLNGLSVGDTIVLQTYGYDPNIDAHFSNLYSTCFPASAIYSHVFGFSSEPEEYTIVGLYRQDDAWTNQGDAYGITPNTVYVSKGSISGKPLMGKSGIYYTLVLQNGKMQEFMDYQAETGYRNMFICYDQGYSEIQADLASYETVSSRALYVGIGGYLGIILLFLVLFPLGQKRNLAIMASLGADRNKQMNHVLVATFGILLPGSIVGGICGGISQNYLSRELMESVAVNIPMEANSVFLIPVVVLVQMAMVLITTGVLVILTVWKNRTKGKA